MAITYGATVSEFEVQCQNGGFVKFMRVTFALTAAASSSFDSAFMTSIGAPQGKVVGATFASSAADMATAGGEGLVPYVDYANQALEWRNAKTGAVDQTPAAQSGANDVGLDLIVRV